MAPTTAQLAAIRGCLEKTLSNPLVLENFLKGFSGHFSQTSFFGLFESNAKKRGLDLFWLLELLLKKSSEYCLNIENMQPVEEVVKSLKTRPISRKRGADSKKGFIWVVAFMNRYHWAELHAAILEGVSGAFPGGISDDAGTRSKNFVVDAWDVFWGMLSKRIQECLFAEMPEENDSEGGTIVTMHTKSIADLFHQIFDDEDGDRNTAVA